MNDWFLLLTPVLVGGVLALAGFVGCDRVLGLVPVEPPPPPPNQILDFAVDENNPPATRNDFTGWIGVVIQPTADQKMVGVGRWCSPGNSRSHQVKIVDAATGLDLDGTSVPVPLASATPNAFAFVAFPAEVLLSAGQSYYVLSQEAAGQDGFIDYSITVTPSADFQLLSAVYGDPMATPPVPYTTIGMANNCYGPVNAQY